MSDKTLMRDLLLLERGSCDLLLHGAMEASNSTIHKMFKDVLNNSLTIQCEISNTMKENGWINTPQIDKEILEKAKQKYV